MKEIAKLFLIVIAVIITVMFAGVVADIIFPRTINVEITPDLIISPTIDESLEAAKAAKDLWDNDTSAWHREQFEIEAAFNGQTFEERYGK